MATGISVSTTLHRVFLAGSVLALRNGSAKVSCAHLLAAMVAPELPSRASEFLLAHGITAERILSENGVALGALGSLDPARVSELPDAETVLHALDVARRAALAAGSDVIRPEHMVLGILQCGDPALLWLHGAVRERVVRAELDIPLPLSRGMRRAIATGKLMAHALGSEVCASEHALLCCLHDPFSRITSWLRSSGAPVETIVRIVDARALDGHALPWLRAHGPVYESAAAAAEATAAVEAQAEQLDLGLSLRLRGAIETALHLHRYAAPASTEAVVAALLVDGGSLAARAVDAALVEEGRRRKASPSRPRRPPPPMLHTISSRVELVRKLLVAMHMPPHVVASAVDEAAQSACEALPARDCSDARSRASSADGEAAGSDGDDAADGAAARGRERTHATGAANKWARPPPPSDAGSVSSEAASVEGSVDVSPVPAPGPPWRYFLARPQGSVAPLVVCAPAADLGPKPAPVNAVTHAGPTASSNWLLPQRVLVGARPAPEHVKQLLAAGVRTFVSLVGQLSTVHWRLRGYPALVLEHLAPHDNAAFLHLPIMTYASAPAADVRSLVAELAQRVRRGERLYLHCMGGHSRTGKVAALLLAALFDMGDEEASHYVRASAALRDLCYSWHLHTRLAEPGHGGGASTVPVKHSSFFVPKPALAPEAGSH